MASLEPLEEIPEGDGPVSFLPPFANAENRELDRLVRDMEKSLEQAEVSLEENSDRISIMEEHLKNVQQELKYTQARVDAKNREIDTEKHLKSLAAREEGRLIKDIEKYQKERQELLDKINNIQNSVYKGNEKMDQFKLLMNWNQEELEQWALAQRQKEEDNEALDKYKHQDEAKMKELLRNVEIINKQVAMKKEELDNEVVETQAAQIQLDKAAEDFRKLHAERQDLIRQWDEAIMAMRHRDEAIAAASEQFAERKAELRDKQAELDSQARFLENEVANNKELDARIAFYDREVGKQRETLQREQKALDRYLDEVELLKAQLSKAANDLATKSIENQEARGELDAKRRRLDVARKRYAALRRRLEGEFAQLDTMDAKILELERIRQREEERLKALIKEGDNLKKEQVKRSQQLFDLRQKERELISEISGGQSQNKNLASRVATLDEQVVRQQELLYNVEFQLQQMERKVARAQGVRSDEETRALTARIERLTQVLEGVNAEHSMLLEQVKRAEEDLLKARRSNTRLRADKAKVEETIATLKLETDTITRQLQGSVSDKEKALVEHDVLKLEVKRLRDVLAMHADEVFSLENRKFQLHASMEERKQEIEVHIEGLKAELKLLREDVHRVMLELRERGLRVDKLSAKYATLASKNQSIFEDDLEPKTQAYYVIQAAQQREELQREGDALDAKIRQAEKEVAALETTLSQLLGCNSQYGQSFKKVDNKTAFQERAALREKLDCAYDKLKYKRGEESALMGDVSVAEQRLNNLLAEQRSLAGQVEELARKKAEVESEASAQQEKYQRARRNVDKLQRTIRGKLGTTDEDAAETVAEKEVRLAEMRDTCRAMLAEVKVLALQNPGLGIAETFEAAGLKLPSGSTSGSLGGGSMGSRGEGSRPTSRGSVRSGVSGSSDASSMRSGGGVA